MSGERLALCQTAGRGMATLHVRVIGARGFKPREGIETRALCGALPLWDVEVAGAALPPGGVCAACESALAAGRRPV